MNKAERELRRILKQYPSVHLDSDGRGFVLIAPGGGRLRIGSLRGNHNEGVRRIEEWCAKQGGVR